MLCFLLSLTNEIENQEMIQMIQMKANEVFSVTKPIIAKLYDDFDVDYNFSWLVQDFSIFKAIQAVDLEAP